MSGRTAQNEQVRQNVDDVDRVQLPIDPDRQAFAGEFVDDIQHAELPSVMCPALDKVVRPDVIGILWPQTDARAIAQPEPASLWLLLWDLEPFSTPDPLDAFDVHRPAFALQQCSDPAVTVSAVLAGKPNDVGGQRLFVSPAGRHLALGRAVLAENPACHAFRHAKLCYDMLDALTTAGRA